MVDVPEDIQLDAAVKLLVEELAISLVLVAAVVFLNMLSWARYLSATLYVSADVDGIPIYKLPV